MKNDNTELNVPSQTPASTEVAPEGLSLKIRRVRTRVQTDIRGGARADWDPNMCTDTCRSR
jgi:hypothetical protein